MLEVSGDRVAGEASPSVGHVGGRSSVEAASFGEGSGADAFGFASGSFDQSVQGSPVGLAFGGELVEVHATTVAGSFAPWSWTIVCNWLPPKG